MFDLENYQVGVYIIITVTLLTAFIMDRFRNAGVVHVALTKLVIDPEASDCVLLEGRKPGVWSWLSLLMKWGNRYWIRVRSTHFCFTQQSASGETLRMIPNYKISAVRCGYDRPLSSLILMTGSLFVFFLLIGHGIIGWGMVALLLALTFVLVYRFSKNFHIIIEMTDGESLGVSFKSRYLENIPVDLEQLVTTIETINRLAIDTYVAQKMSTD